MASWAVVVNVKTKPSTELDFATTPKSIGWRYFRSAVEARQFKYIPIDDSVHADLIATNGANYAVTAKIGWACIPVDYTKWIKSHSATADATSGVISDGAHVPLWHLKQATWVAE